LGTTLEFSERDSLPHHTEMTGGGPFSLAPGVWTDDTSMAMALSYSLIMKRCFDPDDLMTRFVSWWQEGYYSPTGRCFDIGITTSQALKAFMTYGKPYAGDTHQESAGNGSLMRLAPVVLFTLQTPEECAQLAIDQSRTTHAAPQALEACEFFAGILQRAVLGEKKDTLFAPRKWDGHRAMQDIAAGKWRKKRRNQIRSSGYVVHTLEAALWAVDQTDSFEEALILAVNLGDDADTVGAVTGQLAGALYGYNAIPERWLAPLAWRDELYDLAGHLMAPHAPPGYMDEATALLSDIEDDDASFDYAAAWEERMAPPRGGAKTSVSHPLRIDIVSAPEGGLIGMTFCPGKHQESAESGTWKRDLDLDMDAIKQWGATDVVTLMEYDELERYGVSELRAAVIDRGMQWYHLPIVDGDAPRAPFEKAWEGAGADLRKRLKDGGRILLHCRGGLGRTGTIAARLLVELGMTPDAAIHDVRQARSGAIENDEQLEHVAKVIVRPT
jgi:ADP-ribosyl-[dinitrogen reductase] hydrolase